MKNPNRISKYRLRVINRILSKTKKKYANLSWIIEKSLICTDHSPMNLAASGDKVEALEVTSLLLLEGVSFFFLDHLRVIFRYGRQR